MMPLCPRHVFSAPWTFQLIAQTLSEHFHCLAQPTRPSNVHVRYAGAFHLELSAEHKINYF